MHSRRYKGKEGMKEEATQKPTPTFDILALPGSLAVVYEERYHTQDK